MCNLRWHTCNLRWHTKTNYKFVFHQHWEPKRFLSTFAFFVKIFDNNPNFVSVLSELFVLRCFNLL